MCLTPLVGEQLETIHANFSLAVLANVPFAAPAAKFQAAHRARVAGGALIHRERPSPRSDGGQQVQHQAPEVMPVGGPRAHEERGREALLLQALAHELDRVCFWESVVMFLTPHVDVDLRAHKEVRHTPSAELLREQLLALRHTPGTDHQHGVVVEEAQFPAGVLRCRGGAQARQVPEPGPRRQPTCSAWTPFRSLRAADLLLAAQRVCHRPHGGPRGTDTGRAGVRGALAPQRIDQRRAT
mmetsp:Transcript_79548/g.220017  ORF Transcript_79548/g.220017 Transcript_79548/m.220017 type:complete len:241 (-) Transcript_79548:48-770(-)